MNIKQWIAAAVVLSTAAIGTQADAYNIRMTGRTQASPQLQADILARIARYSKEHGGCSFVFSADMQPVAPRGVVAVAATAAAHRGSRVERWQVNACTAHQVFEIAMWPSPKGGADFAIVPLTGRLPLAG